MFGIPLLDSINFLIIIAAIPHLAKFSHNHSNRSNPTGYFVVCVTRSSVGAARAITNGGNMSVRLRDIADHLGLSVSTVSLALRAAPQVAEETRLRVRDTAARLGYIHRPRLSVRTQINQIAFVTQAAPDNVFYAAVLSGAERECRRHNIMLHYTRIDDERSLASSHYTQSDALLIVGSLQTPIADLLPPLDLPIVLVDNNLPFHGFDRILIDNVYSLYRTVTYLAGLGHRNIAFLSGPMSLPSFKERRQGYRQAMSDLGLTPIEFAWPSLDTAQIAPLLARSLHAEGQLGYTALIACNDLAAISAAYAIQEMGYSIPHDVSVVGFDDIDMAAIVRPALTTNRVERELLGVYGVRRLIERAHDNETPPMAITFSTQLIERDSVRRIGAG